MDGQASAEAVSGQIGAQNSAAIVPQARRLEIGTEKYTRVYSMDEKGAGNANHIYSIVSVEDLNVMPRVLGEVRFQNGPIAESGVNGVMNEDHIAIVIDRMDGFQSGKYACDSNEEARTHLKAALAALNSRTKAREDRGVEGTSAV